LDDTVGSVLTLATDDTSSARGVSSGFISIFQRLGQKVTNGEEANEDTSLLA